MLRIWVSLSYHSPKPQNPTPLTYSDHRNLKPVNPKILNPKILNREAPYLTEPEIPVALQRPFVTMIATLICIRPYGNRYDRPYNRPYRNRCTKMGDRKYLQLTVFPSNPSVIVMYYTPPILKPRLLWLEDFGRNLQPPLTPSRCIFWRRAVRNCKFRTQAFGVRVKTSNFRLFWFLV